MEQISIAYILAIVSASGYSFQRPNVDDDSIDATISSTYDRKPKIDIQIKSTSKELLNSEGLYSFALSLKNYNDLRAECCVRLLIVLQMPDSEKEWLKHSYEELAIRKCAFWLSLNERESIDNLNSVTVYIPSKNIFCPDTLKVLMTKTSNGEKL